MNFFKQFKDKFNDFKSKIIHADYLFDNLIDNIMNNNNNNKMTIEEKYKNEIEKIKYNKS